MLDQALESTFPASDPYSVGRPTGTEPPARPASRKPPVIDKTRVERLAKKVPKGGRA
ncbi:MAG TPA: hypothetical protein VNK52_16795 [Hyphomicrobiaceae bacterium]|nr:hypothetical protein [Hyphomicrobiaceae bacterium]